MSENTTPIAELCKRYGLSQSELARRFEIPLRTVQDWHAGRRKAPDYVVKMIDRLLGAAMLDK
jgi:DNA-binding transcriptional regulator YiaG